MGKKSKNLARKHRNWQRWLKLTPILVFGFIILNLAINLAVRLPINQQKPIDAILVLGAAFVGKFMQLIWPCNTPIYRF